MAEAAKKPHIEVGPMTDENAPAVAEFFRAVWDSEATPEKVLSGRKQSADLNPFYPGFESPNVLFLSDGHVLGYCGSIPVAVSCGGQECRAEWVKGLMVLPEHRNGPIGFLLVKDLMRRLDRPLSLVVSDPARRLLAALGMVDLGLVPNFIRLLDTVAVLKKLDLEAIGILKRFTGIASGVRLARRLRMSYLLGPCIDAAMHLKMMLRSPSPRSLQVDVSSPWPDGAEMDRLWREAGNEIGAAPVRDGRYFPWRYHDASTYGLVVARENGRLLGLAIVRRPRASGDERLKGIRLAVLSDLLFSPRRAEASAALFRGAEALAKEYGAEALLCSASHSAVTSQLSRNGYIRIPGNMRFMLADKIGHPALPTDLSSWWITRGDSNADEVF